MNEQEKGMIEGLFQRLRQAESQMGQRDAEAEALINGFMTRQSAAPYLLSQVVLVQEQGLKNLQAHRNCRRTRWMRTRPLPRPRLAPGLSTPSSRLQRSRADWPGGFNYALEAL